MTSCLTHVHHYLTTTMQPLTNNIYNAVCESYEHFGSKSFDEMFIVFEDDSSISYLYAQDYYEAKV